MNTTRRLAIGSASRVILSLSQMAVGFMMLPFLVRNLGDHWYGVWTVVGSTIAYLTMMDLGLSQAIILYVSRFIPLKKYDSANRVVNTAFFLYFGISLAVLMLTALLATFAGRIVGSPDDGPVAATVILILGLSLAIELPFNSLSGIVAAHLRYELLSGVRLLVLAFNTVCIFYFVGRGYGILSLALVSLASCILFNILYYAVSKYCFRQLQFSRRWFDKSCISDLTHIGVWSFLSNLGYLLKFRLNVVVLSMAMGPVAVTHFAVGSRLADYFRDLLFQATNLSTPVLTKYHVMERKDELRDKLVFLLKLNTALAIFAGGMILVLGSTFVFTWMGPSYDDAFPVLAILVIAMVLEISLDPARCALAGMGQNRLIALLELTEAICGLILSVILVRRFGIIGVAIGTAAPIVASKVFLMPGLVCKQVGMAKKIYYRSMLPIVLATVAYLMLFNIFIAKHLLALSYMRIVVVGALACPIYGVLAYSLFFTREERLLIIRLLPGRSGA